MTVSEARSVLMSVVPEYAVSAWRDCMRDQALGQLQVWVTAVDEDSAILRVRWIAGGGFSPMSHTKVTVDPGAKVYADEFSPNETFDGEASIHVIRRERYQSVKGSVSGMSNHASFSSEFTVPRFPKLVRQKVDQMMDFGPATIGAYRTEAYAGSAHLELTCIQTAHWVLADDQHWMRCALSKDGQVFDQTSKTPVAKGAQTTVQTRTLTLEIPPGKQFDIQVRNDNVGATSDNMILKITGWGEAYE